MEECDVLIVGAGPGGLAAAKGAKDAGANNVVLVERNNNTGGILNQCIHDGFGLVRYKKQLSGPEYAEYLKKEIEGLNIKVLLNHHVVEISPKKIVTIISPFGLSNIKAKSIVLATGCRERTRGMISIPGSRPAGVFTAGVAQHLVNVQNIMPGQNVVILGSGDVGMIMARRLTLEGANVKAVVEVLPEPAGLARNVSQCLYEYDIPLYCSHNISDIIGKKRVEAVEIVEIDKNGNTIIGTNKILSCDTLILSVGLIPENEVAKTAGIKLDEKRNGVITNEYLETNVSGIFSCGNSREIMDLADFVSLQGEVAGFNAVSYIEGLDMKKWINNRNVDMKKGFPIQGVITCTLCPNGCQIKNNKNRFKGNNCPKGEAFAIQEITAPKRIITSTVKTKNGHLLPVRSKTEVPKECISEVFRRLQNVVACIPIKCGDEVINMTIEDSNNEVIEILIISSATVL